MSKKVVTIGLTFAMCFQFACGRDRKPAEEAGERLVIDRRTQSPGSEGGPGAPGAERGATATELQFTPCPPRVNPVAPPSGVEVTMELPETQFSRNEPIPIVLTVRNNSGSGVSRGWSRDQLEREYWISNDKGVVWRWSYGDELRGAAGSTVYEPGEERRFPEEWPATVDGKTAMVVCWGEGKRGVARAPGRYAVQGFLADKDGHWITNQVVFEIT